MHSGIGESQSARPAYSRVGNARNAQGRFEGDCCRIPNAGGRITARYVTTGRELEAANAGDYVYPRDVRFNAQTNLLFVKASGLAGGITHETWLFEYDLIGQRLIERRRVADSALPTECPESP